MEAGIQVLSPPAARAALLFSCPCPKIRSSDTMRIMVTARAAALVMTTRTIFQLSCWKLYRSVPTSMIPTASPLEFRIGEFVNMKLPSLLESPIYVICSFVSRICCSSDPSNGQSYG